MSILERNYNLEEKFSSTKLKIGEMMEIELNKEIHVILKTYDRFVSLSEPIKVWTHDVDIIGRKLLKGESITLTQE